MSYDLSKIKIKNNSKGNLPNEIRKISDNYYMYAPIGAKTVYIIKDNESYFAPILNGNGNIPIIDNSYKGYLPIAIDNFNEEDFFGLGENLVYETQSNDFYYVYYTSNGAVYSADDNSLTFLYSVDTPTTASFGKTVTATYPADDGGGTSTYTSYMNVPGYSYRTNIKSVEFRDFTSPESKSIAFGFYQFNNSAFTTIDMNNLDVASVTNMSHTFQNCSNLALTSLPEGFGSQAMNMYYTFQGCTNLALTSLPTNFGNQATNMYGTFYSCHKLALTFLPAGFGSQATYMGYIFYNCSSFALTSLPEGFGSQAPTMYNAFYGCSNIEMFDLSNLDMSKVCGDSTYDGAYNMLAGMTKLKSITINNNFKFTGGPTTSGGSTPSTYNVGLPEPSTISPYTGKGTKIGDSSISITSAELMANYGTTYTSGTYVGETTT